MIPADRISETRLSVALGKEKKERNEITKPLAPTEETGAWLM